MIVAKLLHRLREGGGEQALLDILRQETDYLGKLLHEGLLCDQLIRLVNHQRFYEFWIY